MSLQRMTSEDGEQAKQILEQIVNAKKDAIKQYGRGKGDKIMIQVTVGNNVKREKVIVDAGTTLRDLLEEHEIDYSRGTIHLDGSSLSPGDLDKTFADFGIAEKCYLLAVTKTDNAIYT